MTNYHTNKFRKATSIEGAALRACLSLASASPRWRFDGEKAYLGSRHIRPYKGGYATGCYVGDAFRAYDVCSNPVDLIQAFERDYEGYEGAVAEDRMAAYEAAVERGDYDM